MKIFICNRSIDNDESKKIIVDFGIYSENSVVILKETEHTENWQTTVEKKIEEVDFVLFLVGDKTFESDHLKWEYGKAKQLNKQIIGIKLPNASQDSILFCQGFQVFDNVEQCFKFLKNVFENDRQLKIEQYKIMVSSAEKVTEQRLKVNNLFFTITSSILSYEDAKYRDFLVNQARSNRSPFDFVDMSVKKKWKQSEWQKRCRTKIKRCDGVIALLSKNTFHAGGARWEMKCAREEGIKIIGMHIKKNDTGAIPPELQGKKIIKWSWDGLEKFVGSL